METGDESLGIFANFTAQSTQNDTRKKYVQRMLAEVASLAQNLGLKEEDLDSDVTRLQIWKSGLVKALMMVLYLVVQ